MGGAGSYVYTIVWITGNECKDVKNDRMSIIIWNTMLRSKIVL